MSIAIKPQTYQGRKFNIGAVRCNSACICDPVSAPIAYISYWSLVTRTDPGKFPAVHKWRLASQHLGLKPTNSLTKFEYHGLYHRLVGEGMTPIQFLRRYDGWRMWSRYLLGDSINLMFLSIVRTTASSALLIDGYPRNYSDCRMATVAYNSMDIGAG